MKQECDARVLCEAGENTKAVKHVKQEYYVKPVKIQKQWSMWSRNVKQILSEAGENKKQWSMWSRSVKLEYYVKPVKIQKQWSMWSSSVKKEYYVKPVKIQKRWSIWSISTKWSRWKYKSSEACEAGLMIQRIWRVLLYVRFMCSTFWYVNYRFLTKKIFVGIYFQSVFLISNPTVFQIKKYS